MSNDWRNCVNQNAGSERVEDIKNYVINSGIEETAPIDGFYEATQDMLTVINPTFLNNHPSMGPLIFVGFISTTENFFREMFSRIIQICPVSKKKSASQQINLGSVVWHKGLNVERGAFENTSFAGSESIIKASRNYLNYEIKDNVNLKLILEEYDKICELRHGIVHSNSILAGKNAIKLGIISQGVKVKVNIKYNELQECAAICTTLITAFNNEFFELISTRWATEWRAYPLNDYQKLFKEVWKIFHSIVDERNGEIDNSLTWLKCRNKIIKEFNL